MSDNVSDDWRLWFRHCEHCGQRYHGSEGGCDCRDNGICACCGDDCGADDWHDALEQYICENCACCDYCGKLYPRAEVFEGHEAGDEEAEDFLSEGEIMCKRCRGAWEAESGG